MLGALRDLYARFVYSLVRPAMELHKPKFDPEPVIDAMLKDLRKNGPVSRTMRLLNAGCACQRRPDER